VVAARRAWKIYQELYAYVCQPGRAFQDVQYLAFYAGGNIMPLVPRIIEVIDEVIFERGRQTGPLGTIVERFLDLRARDEGAMHKVFVLSPPDDPHTVRLNAPVLNDLAYQPVV